MSLSLLDEASVPNPNPWIKRIGLTVLVLLVVGGLAYWQFRYYREERLVRRFMNALVAGNYPQAYQVWNPVPTYTFQDFLQDWGEATSYGRIQRYEIVEVKPSRGAILQVPIEGGQQRRTLQVRGGDPTGVVVSVRINGREPPERLWVETNPPRISFPPF